MKFRSVRGWTIALVLAFGLTAGPAFSHCEEEEAPVVLPTCSLEGPETVAAQTPFVVSWSSENATRVESSGWSGNLPPDVLAVTGPGDLAPQGQWGGGLQLVSDGSASVSLTPIGSDGLRGAPCSYLVTSTDSTPPVPQILVPEMESGSFVSEDDTLLIVATYSDEGSSIVSMSFENLTTGEGANLECGYGCMGEVALDPGLNFVVVLATDEAGNVGKRIYQIIHPCEGEECFVSKAMKFRALPACRVLDTRDEGTGGAIAGGSTRTVAVSSRCKVPASAVAVAANLTAVGPTAEGRLLINPSDANPPLTAHPVLQIKSGEARANNAMLRLPSDGSGTILVEFVSEGSGTTHFVLDIAGYYR